MIYIIPLCKEHAEEIAVIENESFGDPWSIESFIDLPDNPLAVCFTAIETETIGNGLEVAGYLIAYHIIDEIQILNVAVKKTKRNKKIATKLFDALFEYAKTENVEEFTLEVRPTNTGAIALYKKLGFKIDGIRKNYYKHPKEDALLMSLRLQ